MPLYWRNNLELLAFCFICSVDALQVLGELNSRFDSGKLIIRIRLILRSIIKASSFGAISDYLFQTGC